MLHLCLLAFSSRYTIIEFSFYLTRVLSQCLAWLIWNKHWIQVYWNLFRFFFSEKYYYFFSFWSVNKTYFLNHEKYQLAHSGISVNNETFFKVIVYLSKIFLLNLLEKLLSYWALNKKKIERKKWLTYFLNDEKYQLAHSVIAMNSKTFFKVIVCLIHFQDKSIILRQPVWCLKIFTDKVWCHFWQNCYCINNTEKNPNFLQKIELTTKMYLEMKAK